MKKFGLITMLVLLMGLIQIKAQDNVGIGTNTPHSSALLDLTAADKGLLIPRVTLVNITDGTTPVNGPETGLLIYNTGGSLTEGFYYWDGTQWVMVGSGGSSCNTLDEAYDCGGAGAGASITADANAVSIYLPSTATNDDALFVQSDKGSSSSPTASISAINSQHGAGLYAEITETTNLYSGIQGITNTTLAGSDLATGVSGYHEGTGLGVGVWGEASSNNASGSSYGVYGKGENKSFGGYFYGANWPGCFAETSDASSPALQLASSGQLNTNPAFLTVGWAQIGCGNSGGAGGYDVLLNNIAGEVTIGPDVSGWGFLGASGLEWWAVYTSNAVQVSRRELKRDITYFDNDISTYVMQDIMALKPAFYKYKSENDDKITGSENRTRYNMHLGFILDETPDYLQDNAFSGIDLYSLASLGIAGVQENHKEIEVLKKEQSIQDFGIAEINGNEVRIEFKKDFSGTDPVVSITPLAPASGYYIKSQDENGFTLSVRETSRFRFNWIAMAERTSGDSGNVTIDPELESQLKVSEAKKSEIRDELMIKENKHIELKGADSKTRSAKRYKPE